MAGDPHLMDSDTVFNLRDLSGALIPGRIYRSGELSDPSACDDPVLVGLGLHTVIDLRMASEVSSRPDHLPEGVRYLHFDVLADLPVPFGVGKPHIMSDPVGFVEMFGGDDPQREMVQTYRGLVEFKSAQSGYAAMLRAVLAAEGHAVLIHCTAGKDRTGWAIAILQALAGADQQEIRTEYLSVNPAVREAFGPLIEVYLAGGGDLSGLTPMLEVHESYLEAAWAEVEAKYGDMDAYIRDGLGLTAYEIEALSGMLTA